MMRTKNLMMVFLFLVLLLSACGGNQLVGEQQNTASEGAHNQNLIVEDEDEPVDEQDQNGESAAVPEPSSNLSAGRQLVAIKTSDGRTLEGFYYPAKAPNAPIVVLMHWAPGSMNDWEMIAPWLQNRLDELDSVWVEDWFPIMPEETSFAVLIFNFGKYGRSEYGGSRESYVQDALAALEHAASLHGVDAHRVTAIGASIGADGAVDSCYLFNDAGEYGTCIGALSFSPGNYLTKEFSYQVAADMVDLSGYPVWCLAAENDGASPELCLSLTGSHSRAFIYEGNNHGMALIEPDLSPTSPDVSRNALELVQEFFESAYGTALNSFDLP